MIQTFVFFDIETTGLIARGKMPKITELSFVAVTRNNIGLENKEVPRVLQTLTLPINPNRPIPPEVEHLTDLKSECLQNVSLFNEKIFNLINNFLDTLTTPICFVAHNGYRFDYPIFLWELKHLNKDLAWHILCIDTLSLFKDFFQNNNKNSHISNSPVYSGDKNLYTSFSEEEIQKNQTKRETHIHQKPINFKLTTICKHLLNVPAEKVHTAQGDCINMLRCANYLGEYFLEWCDHNAKPLIEKR